jgi:hypothetical protein
LDFCSLQHIKVRKSTCRGVSRPRYVPPSGFGYPPGGLLLPSPCQPYFMPAALLGFTLRSVPLSQGLRDVSARTNPHAVFPDSTAFAEAKTHPVRPRLLGFNPSKSPLRAERVISTPTAGCSPGFCSLPGYSHDSLDRDPSRPPLTHFAASHGSGHSRCLRVSIGSRFARPSSAGKPANPDPTTLLGSSHRSTPEHSTAVTLGLCVHLMLSRALLSTCQHSLRDPTPCRSCSGSAEVPSHRDLRARCVLQSIRVRRSRHWRFRRRIVLL